MHVNRMLSINSDSEHSFFLWGPRQTGKSTYLRATFKDALFIDLLDASEFRRFSQEPNLLRAEANQNSCIVIDEIQKVPTLLDEVQKLIVERQIRFGLCGSSARKLRRGHANLLGGRAIRYEMFGLVSAELNTHFDLVKIINRGNLPVHYFSEEHKLLVRSYVADYLKEEIANEGLVRNLPSFSQFLDLSALSDTEVVAYSSFARDVGVAVNTVREYFQIMVDTLLCRFVPAYTKRPKRRTIQSPKFYFANVGVVNFLAKRGEILPGSESFGKAFENFVCHELHAYASYSQRYFAIAYWRLTTGIEVDFILGDMQYAVECKATAKVQSDHLKNLRELKTDYPNVRQCILVCLESRERLTDDGILILPINSFLDRLWQGSLALD